MYQQTLSPLDPVEALLHPTGRSLRCLHAAWLGRKKGMVHRMVMFCFGETVLSRPGTEGKMATSLGSDLDFSSQIHRDAANIDRR